MSSAAKLRKYGRGTATVAAAALVMTSFGPAAFAQWDDAPQTANTVETPQDYGTIGINDTDTTGPASNPKREAGTTAASLNHGATLVQAGAKNQSIADVQFTLPNRFKSGDIIDLRLLDRSAIEATDGTSNSGPDTLIGFSADPTVNVGDAAAAGTRVDADTENEDPANTQTDPMNAWTAAANATGESAKAPAVKPKFSVSRSQTNGVQGYDNIRLRVEGNASAGDPNAVWVVTLSDLKVDLGSQVTPGELRVVPFASNKVDDGDAYFRSIWFQGNVKAGARQSASPTPVEGARNINTYTVPAYVAPVTVSSEKTSIIADGNPQTVGTLSLTETKPYALGTGDYALRIQGANVANPSSPDVKATLVGGDSGESVSITSITNDTDPNDTYAVVNFKYTANTTAPTTIAKINISGLLLATTKPAELQFNFTGGTLATTWFATAGTSSAVPGSNIQNSDALTGTPSTVTIPSTKTVSQAAVTQASVTPTGGAVKLPAGEYVVATDPDGGFSLDNGTTILGAGSGANELGPVNGTGYEVTTVNTTAPGTADTGTFTFTGLSAGTTVTVDGTGAIVSTRRTAPVTVTAGLAALPNGTYTVEANSGTTNAADFTVTGPKDLVLGNSATAGAGAPDIITNATSYTTGAGNFTAGTSGVTSGSSFTFNNLVVGQSFTVSGSNAVSLPSGVNQRDIDAPDEDLLQTGVAQAPSVRIGGNNRYETAAKIAAARAGGDKSLVNGKMKNVILASGENFPDALSASYLSQRMNAAILLTQKDSLPQDTIEALRDQQVEKVFVIGGPAAVSNGVLDRIRSLKSYYYDTTDDTVKPATDNLQAVRLSSANPKNDNRYTTNQLVNMYAAAWGGNTIGKTVYKYGEAGKYTAIFARGDNFPDALAAGVLTRGMYAPGDNSAEISQKALPLVLTQSKELSESAKEQVGRLDIEHALIVGSADAVSDDVKKSLEDMGLTNTRIGGSDRYSTAAAVDEFAMRDGDSSANNQYPGLNFIDYTNGVPVAGSQVTSFVANGLKFPDALAAATWVGRTGNVLNLVWPNELTDGTTEFYNKRAADIDGVIGLGLGDAVSNKVLNDGNKIVSTK